MKFAQFIHRYWGAVNPHCEVSWTGPIGQMCAAVQSLADSKEAQHFDLKPPPCSGATTVLSIMAPVWMAEQKIRVGVVTHSGDLANSNALRAQDLADELGLELGRFQPHYIAPNSRLVGKHWDVLIADNWQDPGAIDGARSYVPPARVDWFQGKILSRKTKRLLVSQAGEVVSNYGSVK